MLWKRLLPWQQFLIKNFIFVMESKELIQSCLHAKAWSFICSRLENLLGGGSEIPPPPPPTPWVNLLQYIAWSSEG